ncbi:MAG TPA: signal recognition particle-docking protein FtsY, partial [Lactobacillus sp.]|nr:signal recognition particle-docking protein FtsY [Lactobacillus sp.]
MGLFDAIKKAFTGEEPETPEENKYDEGLEKSRSSFGEKLNALFANFRTVDEDFFDDLEEMLIESDVGFETAVRLSDELREEVKLKNAKDPKAVSRVIVEKLVDMYGEAGKGEDNQIHFAEEGPTVFLFVGVNGAGKTTTVGKLAHQLKEEGKRVLLVAADTFRAGAIQQLQEWGRRVDVPVVATKEGGDPAGVVF